MNYRHAFHAGNFADVVKHVVLTRILLYLHEKPSAFRVIDTHAGAGLYDLRSIEAKRSAEWQDGIARVMAADFSGEAATLLAPYLDIVRAFNTNGDDLIAYPGSPLVARALLRPQDRLVACETEGDVRAALIRALRHDPQGRVVEVDGWTALGAMLPPPERRGLVLIDPPYEARDEFDRLAAGFELAFKRWPTGIFLMWYPMKQRVAVETFARRVGTHADKVLRLDITVSPPSAEAGLTSAGLLVVNPPWTLQRELGVVMPALAKVLGRDRPGDFRLEQTGSTAAGRR
jgi:23S rRNA (adenine2030-N6)-methyltransferase